MPSEYTMETLPKPNNKLVTISEEAQTTRYVWKFWWWANESMVKKETQLFTDELKAQNLETSGGYTLSQYNDPWTPPFMRKNELWIQAK